MPSLATTTDLFRLLGDPTRLRLLALVAREELTVAELVRVTRLPQPRVSTHLGKLREAGLLIDRRDGSSVFYRQGELGPAVAAICAAAREGTDDPLLKQDARRLGDVLLGRRGATWADAVAGQMARHYSPGRTWESLARGIVGLARIGRLLDIASGDGAVAELLAPKAQRVVCLDISERVVALGSERLAHLHNLGFEVGDMHDLPFEAHSFDQVLLMNALPYTREPETVLAEVARVLVPGGGLVGSTLCAHPHAGAVSPFNHVNTGYEAAELARLLERAGLVVESCERTCREKRPPHFEIITFTARAPGAPVVERRVAQRGAP